MYKSKDLDIIIKHADESAASKQMHLENCIVLKEKEAKERNVI